MKYNKFLFENMKDIQAESLEILQERLFGLPDKKKTKNASNKITQTQEFDAEVTPTYIRNVLSLVRDNTQKVVEKFIEDEYNKIVERFKQQNPESFRQYLLDYQGDDDENMFKKQFLDNLWKDIAKEHGAMIPDPKKSIDAEPNGEVSKNPFLGVFERSLFNKDNYPNVPDILNFKFGADKKELDKYFHIYENITTDKEKIARIGFSDEAALIKVITLKLAMIRLGYMFLRDDPRLEETYGKDSDNPKTRSGKEIVQSEMQKMASQYSMFIADANRIATEWYDKLKKNPPKNMNAYESAIIPLHTEIEKTIRAARIKEEEKNELGYGFVQTNVETQEPQTQEPQTQEPQTQEPQTQEPDEKQSEISFANDRYKKRQMLSPYSGQNAISAIENPEKVFNLSEEDFRDMKTVFAYNNPFDGREKEKFQQNILSSTKAEFVKFLKNLRKNTDMFSEFFELWNSNKIVNGKLFTHLLKGEEHGTQEASAKTKTKASAKTKTKAPAKTKEEKVSSKNVSKAQTQKPSPIKGAQTKKNTSGSGVKLSPEDISDAALQSSKGIEDYLSGGGMLNT